MNQNKLWNIICDFIKHIEHCYLLKLIDKNTKLILENTFDLWKKNNNISKSELLTCIENYGCYNIYQCMSANNNNFNDDLFNKNCLYSNLNKYFIPLKCTKNNNTCEYQINFINNDIINYAELSVDNLIIGGIFYNDKYNIIVQHSDLKKHYDDTLCLINKTHMNKKFRENYIKHIKLYHIFANFKYITNQFNLFKRLKKSSLKNIISEFENISVNGKFTFLFLFLLDNDFINIQIAHILFNKIPDAYSYYIYDNLDIIMKNRLKSMKKIDVNNDNDNDILYKINTNNLPEHVKKHLIKKYKFLDINNSDYEKQLLYINTLLKFPWNTNYISKQTKKAIIDNALNVLNDELFGQKDCKDEIINLISSVIINPNKNGFAIGLYGPPGIGKTLIAKTIGKAFDIPFAYINLCGHNDADLLFGHSYTYSNSQPGIIINKIIECNSSRCILFFDELDKTTDKNNTNEIFNVFINLIDYNTNHSFRDKFFNDITFPLNKVIFIFSYNNRDIIHDVLRDRIIEIRLNSYNICDKINIAQKFIIPNICNNNNIKVNINDKCIEHIIINYTNESGVRNLERKIEKIIINSNLSNISNISLVEHINKFLNEDKINIINFVASDVSYIGNVNSLCTYNDQIYGIMPVQVITINTRDNIYITGNVSNIMKDSITCAYSFVTKLLSCYNLCFHVHLPNINELKDGSSAGLAIAISFISCINNHPIINNIAFTGEIDIFGNILPVNNIYQKLYGALRSNITKCYIPLANKHDAESFINNNNDISIIFADNINDVLKYIFE